MASVSERPTQVHPTTPVPPAERSGGLTPHEPAVPGPGGPGEPPRPPRRTGGGGGGGGGDHGDGGPGDPDRRNRTSKLAVVGAGLVLLIVVLVLAFGGGEEDDTKIADTTPAQQASPAPASGSTELKQVPDGTPAPSEAEATPAPDSSGQDDSDAATTPQEETGGIAVGGAGQTGDASDSADAEAESTAPLLTAGKVAKLTFKQGETVRFRVESDTAQEVHVHGYDKKYDLGAGETQTIAFPANLTGIFEVEFEGTGTQIGELTIEP